jgi:hypothetical protein
MYTKVCGGGRCKSNVSLEISWIISDYGNCKSEYGELEYGGENLKKKLAIEEKEKLIL